MRKSVVGDLQIHANENARTRCPGVFNFIATFSTLMARNNCRTRPSAHSTVTDLAKLRGLSTSVPFTSAAWYDSNCSGMTCRTGDSMP